MRSYVDREKLRCVSLHCYDCTGGERHAGGSNRLSENFETHTRLSHVLYSSNSLCVHRLQVQHCMLVGDWQLRPPHCGLEYVQYVWVQYWTVNLVWKRDRNSGRVHMHRGLFFFFLLLFFTCSLTLTWFQVAKCKCHNSATVLLYTLINLTIKLLKSALQMLEMRKKMQ